MCEPHLVLTRSALRRKATEPRLDGSRRADRRPWHPIPDFQDKLTVARTRSTQRFLSQPFFVAEQFTGMKGKYVPKDETVRGFKEILAGKHDNLPEGAFYMVGGIEEAIEKARKMVGG